MRRQITSWGYIEWLSPKGQGELHKKMNVGLVTILRNAHQEPHIHYENEQFIYVLQGEGIDYIDGAEHPFHEAMFYYMQPNVTHELVNTGDEPILHLVVTVSTADNDFSIFEEEDNYNFSNSFFSAVEAIQNQIMSIPSLAVTIFDDMGNIVLQNEKYPSYCLRHCSPLENLAHCACFANRTEMDVMEEDSVIVCPYGLTVIRMPIVHQNRLYGSIVSGHIFFSDQAHPPADVDLYDTTQGTMIAIQKWMASVVKSILSFCHFATLRQSLNQKELLISKTQQDQQQLEKDLEVMKNEVINLKINHHFLYNTLNAIAGLSLEAERLTVYQSITALAKMFRYSTDSHLKMVPLRAEMEYLNTYLHMQKIRYKEELSIEKEWKEEVLGGLVPFNFLQPIVENVFTHGFLGHRGLKQLRIQVKWEGERMVITVWNNGQNIDPVTLVRLQKSMENNSGHGMSMVYNKLLAVYGDNFDFGLLSDEESGTEIRIHIPYLESEEGRI